LQTTDSTAILLITILIEGEQLQLAFFRSNFMARVEIVAVVLTISDSAARGEREDQSGPAVVAELEKLGARIAATEIVSDDRDLIAARLRDHSDRGDVNLICTTGGTGFAPRDNTPEATRDVIEREAPGLAELMRLRSLDATPLAPLSRAVCGIRGRTLIVNLPGSVRGATQNFTAIRSSIPHAIGLITGQSSKCAS
jgi:molybdopterin adenylyltransferase